MSRIQTILLAFVVAISNMVCACVASSVPDTECHGRVATADAKASVDEHAEGGCLQSAPVKTPCDDKSNSHDCAHCTGTISGDAPKARSNLDSPFVSPLLTLSLNSFVTLSPQSCDHSFSHCGLSPPPIPPPTLLSLGCSLNN